jgi:hypothetical protein
MLQMPCQPVPHVISHTCETLRRCTHTSVCGKFTPQCRKTNTPPVFGKRRAKDGGGLARAVLSAAGMGRAFDVLARFVLSVGPKCGTNRSDRVTRRLPKRTCDRLRRAMAWRRPLRQFFAFFCLQYVEGRKVAEEPICRILGTSFD